MIGISGMLNDSDESDRQQDLEVSQSLCGNPSSTLSSTMGSNSLQMKGSGFNPCTSDHYNQTSTTNQEKDLAPMSQSLHLNRSGSTTSKYAKHEPGFAIPRPSISPSTHSPSSGHMSYSSGDSSTSATSRLSLNSGSSSSSESSTSTPYNGKEKVNAINQIGSQATPGTNAIPRSKIQKKHLADRTFVKLAIRRKSNIKKPKILATNLISQNNKQFEQQTECNVSSPNSKLHVKSLEAGLRVKLTMAKNLISLYHSLIPFNSKKDIVPIFADTDARVIEGEIYDLNCKEEGNRGPFDKFTKRALHLKSVKLIDNNLVNLNGFSNKILQSFNLVDDEKLPKGLTTFNSLDTAVRTLFGFKDYSLIRVTRSTSDDLDGSVVLKLETAHRGDFKLIDEEEFMDEMIYSLGNKGDAPTNLFIKKVVARPRYKSDMKIYLIGQKLDCSIYTDERMFERDLFNGVIDINFALVKKESPIESGKVDYEQVMVKGDRDIFVTFPYREIIDEYQKLLRLSGVDDTAKNKNEHEQGDYFQSRFAINDYEDKPQKRPKLDTSFQSNSTDVTFPSNSTDATFPSNSNEVTVIPPPPSSSPLLSFKNSQRKE